jgi:hypothetical protein
MSGQRVAVVVGLAMLALLLASIGVLPLGTAVPEGCRGIPFDLSSCSEPLTLVERLHPYMLVFLLLAGAAALGAFATWASRPRRRNSEKDAA